MFLPVDLSAAHQKLELKVDQKTPSVLDSVGKALAVNDVDAEASGPSRRLVPERHVL
jgi:hypothetical protein